MKYEVTVKTINNEERSFITKDYDEYSPVIKKVNDLKQIGFVKEVIVTEATTGRRIESYIATH